MTGHGLPETANAFAVFWADTTGNKEIGGEISANALAFSRARPEGPRNFVKLKKVETRNSDINPEVASDPNLPVETLDGQLASVTAERDQLKAERADLQDRLHRALADFDNARRRSEQQRFDYLQFAAKELVRDLLPMLDDFERALGVETPDRDYAKGVELIYQRLYETLKKMGLEPIETAGTHFDPNLHQAVERVPSEEAEDQAILGEYQRGYNFKGKLLRPAMVRVAVRS